MCCECYARFKKKDGDKYIYNYYPHENMDAPGEIYVTDQGERGIISISSDDVKNWYAALVFRKLTNGSYKPGTKELYLYFKA